jgi:hypothetical protein
VLGVQCAIREAEAFESKTPKGVVSTVKTARSKFYDPTLNLNFVGLVSFFK